MIAFKHLSTKKGFSLIELLIVIAISAILLAGLMTVTRSGLFSTVGIQGIVAAQQDVRLALQLMNIEIGMASYNPTFKNDDNFWVTNRCISSPNQEYKGIQEATPTSLTINMVTDNGDWIGDDPNEVIRYAYNIASQRITRATNCGVEQPFLGDSVAENRPRIVRVINNTTPITNGLGQIAIFRYYDGRGNEIYPGNNPSVIPQIRRIDIVIAVESDQIDPNTKERKKMIYSSSVIPRNHSQF